MPISVCISQRRAPSLRVSVTAAVTPAVSGNVVVGVLVFPTPEPCYIVC